MTQDVPSPQLRWNHNTHFHARVLGAVSDGASTALDVGTGNGLLARDLYDAGLDVTAIDLDADVLSTARTTNPDAGINWLHGDVMGHDFGRRFDDGFRVPPTPVVALRDHVAPPALMQRMTGRSRSPLRPDALSESGHGTHPPFAT